ncbi:hypothetical protein AN639_02755 [Candidatus Epulonipiscium fishelsonii]|nr:hypothetical protein AN639_02755 [Epulopiscium sp. SCG-B05WGA-EpuloA1]
MKLKTLVLGTILMCMSIPTFAAETAPAPMASNMQASIATLELPVGESKPVAYLTTNTSVSVMAEDANRPTILLPDFLEGGPVADGPWSSDIPVGPTPVIYVPDPANPAPIEKNVAFEGEGILMEKVYIVDIKNNDGQISVVIGNPEDPQNPMEQTIFHLTDQTTVKHIKNRRLYTPAALEVGQLVNIEHAHTMSMSIPAQSTAYAITLMDEEELVLIPYMENACIVDIKDNDGQISVVIGNPEDPQNPMEQTIFHLTEQTTIKHVMNGDPYTSADLKVGQIIDIEYSPMMTRSIPAQSNAYEIILTGEEK